MPASAGLQAIEFQPPAQLGGTLNGTGTWALFIFKGQDAGFDATLAGPVQYDNVTDTEAHVDGYRFNATPQSVTSHDPATFASVQAHAAFAQRPGSLYVEAQRLRFTAGDFTGLLKDKPAASCLSDLLSDTELYQHVARSQCSGTHDAALRAEIPPSGGTISFQVEAENVTKLEWYSASITCSKDPCPSGGGSSKTTVPLPLGRSITSTSYSYGAFAATGGRLTGFGTTAVVLAGGPRVDLDVAGWVRLPEGHSTGGCGDCFNPANHTLWARGQIQLSGLEPSPSGMRTQFGGNLTGLSLDETPVAKVTLEQLGWATAGAAAAIAVATVVVYKIIAAGLFTRLFERGLQNPRRKAIHDYVQQHPGTTLRELSRATGIPRTTLRAHATLLVRSRLLTEIEQRGSHRFFPAKAGPGWQKTVLMREPPLHDLLEWVHAHPGVQQKKALDYAETT
ncbi:MAG: winged helix-turn-helix transcriptional regulator, partial [Halobacteriales archaeon]|nr:winged helix-turn-helix transcriptional regulator [Halobacteriales archaeon]